MRAQWFVIVALGMALTVVRFASAAEEDEGKETKTIIPASRIAIWQEVTKSEESLSKIIADKKLDKVHEVAYAVRDLINALAGQSADLPRDKLAKVTSYAKYIADMAKRLDASGDAGDQAAVEVHFKKLQDFLHIIEAQYPTEKLKAVEK